MRFAITYDGNGNVFPHFGRTEQFKLYEVSDGEVVSSEIVSTDGVGHEALAGFLADANIDVLICGGLGGGAQAALSEAGILAISGAEGNADDALQAFLNGELQSQGVNCDHHEEEEEDSECGGDCGGECGGNCGSCGGGCPGCGGASEIILEGPNAGKTVSVHYRGTFNDGTQFDSSYDRNEPLTFLCGAGMMIPGFDKAVVNMKVGESMDIHLSPEEAYGMPDPRNIITVEYDKLPGSEKLSVGQQVYLSNGAGRPFPVKVTAMDDETITFDANHEMAGKELNFHIEVVEIAE